LAQIDIKHLNSEVFVSAALDGLTKKVRANIRSVLMEAAEKEVDEAVDKAIESLKIDLNYFVNMQDRSHIFNVLVNKVSQ
jgi:hypothetical protein